MEFLPEGTDPRDKFLLMLTERLQAVESSLTACESRLASAESRLAAAESELAVCTDPRALVVAASGGDVMLTVTPQPSVTLDKKACLRALKPVLSPLSVETDIRAYMTEPRPVFTHQSTTGRFLYETHIGPRGGDSALVIQTKPGGLAVDCQALAREMLRALDASLPGTVLRVCVDPQPDEHDLGLPLVDWNTL